MSRFTKKAGGSGNGEEGGALVFVKPADLARAEFTGIVAEGTFLEAVPNNYDETRDDFKILADVAFTLKGIDKDGDLYTKDVAKGDTLVINGAGNLNYLMKSVSPGKLCQINYNGKTEIEKGKFQGKLAHNFEVMYE